VKRVAVFGNAGGGKSTLARRLAEITGLPLHVIDLMQFRPGGDRIPHEEFLAAHAALLHRDEWIIDGYGSVDLAWERFAAADTLVYVDLPLAMHHWFVTKRLVKGLFSDPEGWPKNSPLWASSWSSYKVLWLCHLRLTPRYRQLAADMANTKRVHHLRSKSDVSTFLNTVRREYASPTTA
jgi:adenylate kinase family enzyme